MRSYVNYSIIRKCLYFVDFTTFQILGQKLSIFFSTYFDANFDPNGPKGQFDFEIN